MRVLRAGVAWLLIVGLGTPVFAGDLRGNPAKATEQQPPAGGKVDLRTSIAKAFEEQTSSGPASMPKGYLWAGTALFVGGMAAGIYGFLNNKNGKFPEFGEAESTNTNLGVAGLVAAFAGGTLLFLGARAKGSPAVTFGPDRVTVSKQLAW